MRNEAPQGGMRLSPFPFRDVFIPRNVKQENHGNVFYLIESKTFRTGIRNEIQKFREKSDGAEEKRRTHNKESMKRLSAAFLPKPLPFKNIVTSDAEKRFSTVTQTKKFNTPNESRLPEGLQPIRRIVFLQNPPKACNPSCASYSFKPPRNSHRQFVIYLSMDRPFFSLHLPLSEVVQDLHSIYATQETCATGA